MPRAWCDGGLRRISLWALRAAWAHAVRNKNIAKRIYRYAELTAKAQSTR